MPRANARAAWGFDRSDLTPHPGVHFGVLANGMRYALMRHAASKGGQGGQGGLSVRLHLDAGASVEDARQSGWMHLLEHLIFHGSANLPPGALLFMLPHAGMKRFADFGAVTNHDDTVYRLDLARTDMRARATALTVMREIGRDLRFDRRIVEAAKKDVRAEIAARDAVADRLETGQNAFLFPGTPIGRAPVIGTWSSVARANGDALRRLYARHYRPERATLVMVGDFDIVTAEREIVARMSDWQTSGSVAPPRSAVPVAADAADAQADTLRLGTFAERSAPTLVAIAAISLAGGADVSAGRDVAFLQHLGAEMLGRRLTQAGTRATSSVSDHPSTGRLALLEMSVPDRNWRAALAGGAAALATMLRDGFTQEELDAQILASRRALAAAAAPRTNAMLADAIIDAVGRRILFTAPADESAADAYLARVRLAEVNGAIRRAWAGPQSIFVAHDRVLDKAELALAWKQMAR